MERKLRPAALGSQFWGWQPTARTGLLARTLAAEKYFFPGGAEKFIGIGSSACGRWKSATLFRLCSASGGGGFFHIAAR